MFQDAHVHFQDCTQPAAESLLKATPSGIGRFFCNAADESHWDTVARLVQTDSRIQPFYGIHPWFAAAVNEGWEKRLETRLKTAAGLGEIGLDRARKKVDFAKQKDVFIRQIGIAREQKKPFVVHCVGAWATVLELLRQEAKGCRFMIHSFFAAKDLLHRFLDCGAFLSYSLKRFEREPDRLRELIVSTPEDRLLLETDFPYSEKKKSGSLSETDYGTQLRKIYETAAETKKMDLDRLQETAWKNGSFFLHGNLNRSF